MDRGGQWQVLSCCHSIWTVWNTGTALGDCVYLGCVDRFGAMLGLRRWLHGADGGVETDDLGGHLANLCWAICHDWCAGSYGVDRRRIDGRCGVFRGSGCWCDRAQSGCQGNDFCCYASDWATSHCRSARGYRVDRSGVNS